MLSIYFEFYPFPSEGIPADDAIYHFEVFNLVFIISGSSSVACYVQEAVCLVVIDVGAVSAEVGETIDEQLQERLEVWV
jgi:hypothetical protein